MASGLFFTNLKDNWLCTILACNHVIEQDVFYPLKGQVVVLVSCSLRVGCVHILIMLQLVLGNQPQRRVCDAHRVLNDPDKYWASNRGKTVQRF